MQSCLFWREHHTLNFLPHPDVDEGEPNEMVITSQLRVGYDIACQK